MSKDGFKNLKYNFFLFFLNMNISIQINVIYVVTIYFFFMSFKNIIGNIIIPTPDERSNYCNIKKCVPATHTLCKYFLDKPSDKCTDYISTGLTFDEIKEIIQIHNEFRTLIASGNESKGNPGPQFAAKKMPNLTWDHELAVIAQRWANQCDFGHDECRDVERFFVGQNAAQMWDSASSLTVKNLVQIWYDEVNEYDRYSTLKFQFDLNTAHYTQLVWANTKLIGCGMVRYVDEKLNTSYLVCNYGPAGNFIDEPVYNVKYNVKAV